MEKEDSGTFTYFCMTREGQAVVTSWINVRKLIKIYNSEGEVIEVHQPADNCGRRDNVQNSKQVKNMIALQDGSHFVISCPDCGLFLLNRYCIIFWSKIFLLYFH